jgi:hypothetical protein
MPAVDTTVGMSVTWNSVEIGTKVMDPSLQISNNPVDCSGVGDATQDNRAGQISVAGSLTVILKDSYSCPIDEGDTGVLGIDGETQTVLASDVTYGGGNNAPHTLAFNFVSTLKAVST